MTDYTKVSLTMRNCTMSLDGYERLHAVEKQVNIKPHNSITDQSWDGGRISVASFTVSVIMECMFIFLTGEINWLRTSTSSLHVKREACTHGHQNPMHCGNQQADSLAEASLSNYVSMNVTLHNRSNTEFLWIDWTDRGLFEIEMDRLLSPIYLFQQQNIPISTFQFFSEHTSG